MRHNPAYQRLETYGDAEGLTLADVASYIDAVRANPDGAVAATVEDVMFPEGRPAGDGTRRDSALVCYAGVLLERRRAARRQALADRIHEAGVRLWRLRLKGRRLVALAPEQDATTTTTRGA